MDIREAPSGGALTSAPMPRDGRRTLLAATAVVVAATAALAASVLVPYFVNDLHQVPLAEVASGAHDPKDMWPQGTAGGLLQLAGLLAVVAVLPGAAIGAALSVAGVLTHARRPRSLRGVIAGTTLLLLSAALLAGYASPLGSALATWRLD